MAPKQKQMLLSFGPKATLPDRRQEGAVVVTRVDASAPPAPPPVALVPDPSPAKKPRRDLSVIVKSEIIAFQGNHSVEETLAHFPEVSRRTVMRIKADAANIRAAAHAGRGKQKRKRRMVKYSVLSEKLYQFFTSIRDA